MSIQTAGENRIVNPWTAGKTVTIPAGVRVRTTHPQRRDGFTTKRATTVTLRICSDGWIDLWNDNRNGCGYVCLPTITWAGTGGYWCDVKVTPELCEALGVPVPALPLLDAYASRRLDFEPSYGTDNRIP